MEFKQLFLFEELNQDLVMLDVITKRDKSKNKHHSGRCKLCNTFRFSLHMDHIKPKCMGGTNSPNNIQFICANCHEDKTREDMTLFWNKPENRVRQKRPNNNYKHTIEMKQLISQRTSKAMTPNMREKLRIDWYKRNGLPVPPKKESRGN